MGVTALCWLASVSALTGVGILAGVTDGTPIVVEGVTMNGSVGCSKCSFTSLGILLLLGFKCSLVL